MHIIELDAIPREKDKLVLVIGAARRKQLRSTVTRIAAGLCVVLASCMLIFAFVRSHPPTKAHAQPSAAKNTIYLPVVSR